MFAKSKMKFSDGKSGKKSFAADQQGNVVTLFALSLIPLIGVVGAGVDYGRTLRAKAELQNTVDSAVIAGATVMQTTRSSHRATEAVQKFVAAKYTTLGSGSPVVDVTIDPAGIITANTTVDVPTTLMRVLGQSTMSVKVTSQAVYGLGKTEIVIALDVTASMNFGGKLPAAQTAAIGLVNTLFAQPGAASKVKVGFVPFNYYVNVGTGNRGASWLTSTADYSTPNPAGCYDTFPGAVYGPVIHHHDPVMIDGVPGFSDWDETPVISYGPPTNVCYPAGTTAHTWGGAVGSRNYPSDLQDSAGPTNKVPAVFDVWDLPAPLTRLTSNPAVVTTQIAATTAIGETYIQPGMLWAWRMLSPNPPFADGTAYGVANKIIVLMTDGVQTHSPDYPTHNGTDAAQANTLLSQTCTKIKTAPSNVTIYTIAFDVTDPTIQGILSGCATSPDNFFNANSISAMSAAFSQIGAALTGVRVSR